MRTVLLIATLSLAACRDNAANDVDLSTAADMSVPADLKKSADLQKDNSPLGCGGVVQCLMGGDAATCLGRATTKAQMLLSAMVACGARECLGTDAGAGDCADEADQSQGCLQCSVGALMGGACPTEVNACLGDG